MPNTATTKVLTPAREAVWHALRSWDRWSERINTFADTDDAVKYFLKSEVNLSRCPMVTADWTTFDPTWWVFTMQEWRAPIEISVWVPEDRQTLAEQLIEDAIDAVYRFPAVGSTTAGPVAHVNLVCGCEPMILQLNPGQPVQVGTDQKHRLIRSSVVFRLRLQKDPKLRAA